MRSVHERTFGKRLTNAPITFSLVKEKVPAVWTIEVYRRFSSRDLAEVSKNLRPSSTLSGKNIDRFADPARASGSAGDGGILLVGLLRAGVGERKHLLAPRGRLKRQHNPVFALLSWINRASPSIQAAMDVLAPLRRHNQEKPLHWR
jgi:hypothetical protein